MSLNIKNPEAHALAKELAELTGESMTEAILVALRERLARERNTEERLQERLAVLDAIGRDVAHRLGPQCIDTAYTAWPYHENGLHH